MNLFSLPQKIVKKEQQPQMVTRSAGFDHGLLACCDPYLASHNSAAVLEPRGRTHNDVIRLDWGFFVLASPVDKAIE